MVNILDDPSNYLTADHIVTEGEHITTVVLTPWTVYRVAFDQAYYYYYTRLISGVDCYIKAGEMPSIIQTDDNKLIAGDGTIYLNFDKIYINSWHEFYTKNLYIVTGREGAVVEVIGTNNKNSNY